MGELYGGFTDVSDKYHHWEALGLRIAIMKVLLALTVVLLLILMFRLFAKKPTRRIVALTVIPIIGCGVLVAIAGDLIWWGVENRVRPQLPRFRVAAKPLIDHWPTESGTLPGAGPYFAHARRPNLLTLRQTTNYTTTENFGAFVERSPEGVIFFTLEPDYEYFVEYHPNDSVPTYHEGRVAPQHSLVRFARLDDHWYLAKYITTIP